MWTPLNGRRLLVLLALALGGAAAFGPTGLFVGWLGGLAIVSLVPPRGACDVPPPRPPEGGEGTDRPVAP